MMNLNVLPIVALAGLCAGTSVVLGWSWTLPLLRGWMQRPVEYYLSRMGEIGFHERKVRNRLFVIETLFLIALGWFTMHQLGLILGITIFVIANDLRFLVLGWIIETRERLLRSQTLTYATALQGLMQGGAGLDDAMEIVAFDTPFPLGDQMVRVTRENRLGRRIPDSLSEAGSKLKLEPFSLLATAICSTAEQGTELARRLVGLQETLEHREQSERLLVSKTSTARRTIMILAFTPPGFFAMFWVMQREPMMLMFTTREGNIMLAGILGLMYAGIAWARRLLRIK